MIWTTLRTVTRAAGKPWPAFSASRYRPATRIPSPAAEAFDGRRALTLGRRCPGPRMGDARVRATPAPSPTLLSKLTECGITPGRSKPPETETLSGDLSRPTRWASAC